MQEMLAAVRASLRETAAQTGVSELRPDILRALETVPRERFIPPSLRHLAQRNTPLPIDAGQTISQPLIVALMTQLLEPAPDDVILEIGTGSGYQAAVLAELVAQVYSMEIIPALAEQSAALLRELGYANVAVRGGDGNRGWPEHAPFDGIIVTAAAEVIPPSLLRQLKPGGRLVIPVGEQAGHQALLVVEVDANGEVAQRTVLPVRFVPLTGNAG
ncbi:MAG: protein-L-isoaspartate(D-aspartate) O-methyltransferase [Halioglobus sp.]